jgi:arylsulfatase A-like enzyme
MAKTHREIKKKQGHLFPDMTKATRREALKALGIGSLSLGLPKILRSGTSSRLQAKALPHNVILLITDDQGYGDLSCHGNPFLKTPHLDRLREQSVRFTNFHVDPTCSPTRASLLTGRYSSRTGVWHTIMGRSLLRSDETTLADLFSRNGYRTGIFGKWHLGDNYPYRPQDRGFDEVVTIGGGAIGNIPDYWGNDYFDDTYRHNGKWQKYSGYCTDVFFAEAMTFMTSDPSRPFFVYLPTNTPHWPHNVADKYSRPYLNAVPERMATFYGMVANIDENVGRLLALLKETHLEENTILVFLTDNGTSFGAQWDEQGRLSAGFNAGMRGQKGSIYDGGHRVPCFVRWPGGEINSGRDVSRLSAHIDLLPTLVEICGLKGSEGLALDGTSLVLLLKGKKSAWPERTLFVHNQRVDYPIKGKDSAVMTDRWRLINGRELYEIRKDPGQQQQVAADHPEVVRDLNGAYERWWKNISGRSEEFPWIVIGSDYEDPVKLTSHDIHGQVGWDQVHVRRNSPCDGFWAVDFIREGFYKISLMRWPKEADVPILATPEGATEMRPTHARLKVAAIDVSQPVWSGDRSVDFRVRAPKEQTRLQAWFVDGRKNGKTNSAFYVYVKRVD